MPASIVPVTDSGSTEEPQPAGSVSEVIAGAPLDGHDRLVSLHGRSLSGIGLAGKPEYLLAQVVAMHLLGATTDSGSELVQAVELPEAFALCLVPEHSLGTFHLQAPTRRAARAPG